MILCRVQKEPGNRLVFGEASVTTLGLPRIQNRSALWQNVLLVLRHAILMGQLAPGTRLVPDQLARELGVSRGPVTEAIRRLQEEGLVTIAANGRPFVRGLSRRYVHDLYTFRASLDCLAVKMALAASSPPDLTGLWTTVEAMRTHQACDDIQRLADADVAFHRQLIALAENAVLNRVWTTIADLSRSLLAITDQLKSAHPTVADIHAAIISAVATGDLGATEEAVMMHYRFGEELLVTSGLARADEQLHHQNGPNRTGSHGQSGGRRS